MSTMASDHRSSISASSVHSFRRSSVSSTQLPPLPPSTESLASSTSSSAPAMNSAPLPPSKDPAPPLKIPKTPIRKPVVRQKSPLSNEAYFASPASSMPGTFPSTPPITTGMQSAPSSAAHYTSPSTTTTVSSDIKKSPKRPSSVRSLLSFKALRRSSNRTAPEPIESETRPTTPGADSVMSSPRQSLNKKRSGSFWRRKSSLGMSFGRESEDNNEGVPSSPAAMNGDTVYEEEGEGRSITPAPIGDFPTVTKRKSGTFWRRRSSLSLATAFGANNGTGRGQGSEVTDEATGGTINKLQKRPTNGATFTTGQNGIHGDEKEGEDTIAEDGYRQNENALPEIEKMASMSTISARSYSPPPQLPDLIGAGSGLGEDLFKNIG